jgi:hypothetical protein
VVGRYRRPLKIEVDAEWIRETLLNFSTVSRRGRKLRRLLRVHGEHYARLTADREASGVGSLSPRASADRAGARSLGRRALRFGRLRRGLTGQAALLLAKGEGVRDVPPGGRMRGVGLSIGTSEGRPRKVGPLTFLRPSGMRWIVARVLALAPVGAPRAQGASADRPALLPSAIRRRSPRPRSCCAIAR